MESKIIEGQNKKMSFVESTVSVIAGYILTVLIQNLLYPIFGITIPAVEALEISVIIVFAAFIKNFTVRRYFNLLHIKGVSV
jgi:hypothetical protein